MRVSEVAADAMETGDVLPVEPEEQKDVAGNQGTITTYDDGIFTVEIKGAAKRLESDEMPVDGFSEAEAFVPSARMNPLMAVKNGLLFLYGGAYEEGDRTITLSDFYSLDFSKLNEWKTIIQQDLTDLVKISSHLMSCFCISNSRNCHVTCYETLVSQIEERRC